MPGRQILSVLLLLATGLPTAVFAATPPGLFDFEPGGPRWGGGPAQTLAPDTAVVHGGVRSLRLHRDAESPSGFSTVTFSLPADRAGTVIELRGWLKSEEAADWFGLWLRLDGTSGPVGFDNMQRRGLTGTTEWTEYRITMALSPETRTVFCGALIAGTGTLWADDLSLWIDGKPWAEAPVEAHESTILEEDQTFAAGSGFELVDPDETQADNLALLGRVWGFLKYHHPRVTDGSRHWDFELFRVLPLVAAADDLRGAQGVLADWVRTLGEIPPCDPCAGAPEPSAVAQPADLAWLRDSALLGEELSVLLQEVHAARPADGESFWVDFMPDVGNPDFAIEPSYSTLKDVDPGYRLLALYRFWNIIEYWCPNRTVIGEDWPGELRQFVPPLLAAEGLDYSRELLRLVARLNDTHTQLYGELSLRPPGMEAKVPVRVRWLEEQPVVSGWHHPTAGPATGLEPGDIVLAVDDRPWAELFAAWRPYYSASNEMQRLDDMADALMRGPEGATAVRVRRASDDRVVTAERMHYRDLDHQFERWHTRPGDTFQLLDEGVAYLALAGVVRDSVTPWIERALAADAAGLVVDCRSYPGDFPLFELGGHLVTEPTAFATFTIADPANPGTFLWRDGPRLQPLAPHFGRPVVVLVDEVTQSSAEYHALAFRSAPQARVLGGTTAGADGNVSRFVLPGNITTMISGIGVFDADRQPTQRVGIVPDIRVEPTVAGIRAGRDEVLAAAVADILERAGQGR